MEGKEVYRSIEMTDKVKTASLSLIDQIRLIFASMSNDDVLELDKAEKLSAFKLRKIASLRDLFERTIDRMDALGKESAMLKVSSTFLPYIDKVVDKSTGYGQFFDITVFKKDLPVVIPHYFYVKISKRK